MRVMFLLLGLLVFGPLLMFTLVGCGTEYQPPPTTWLEFVDRYWVGLGIVLILAISAVKA